MPRFTNPCKILSLAQGFPSAISACFLQSVFQSGGWLIEPHGKLGRPNIPPLQRNPKDRQFLPHESPGQERAEFGPPSEGPEGQASEVSKCHFRSILLVKSRPAHIQEMDKSTPSLQEGSNQAKKTLPKEETRRYDLLIYSNKLPQSSFCPQQFMGNTWNTLTPPIQSQIDAQSLWSTAGPSTVGLFRCHSSGSRENSAGEQPGRSSSGWLPSPPCAVSWAHTCSRGQVVAQLGARWSQMATRMSGSWMQLWAGMPNSHPPVVRTGFLTRWRKHSKLYFFHLISILSYHYDCRGN